MKAQHDLQSVFVALRRLLMRYAAGFTVVREAPGVLSLDTKHIMPNKKPLFFGAV